MAKCQDVKFFTFILCGILQILCFEARESRNITKLKLEKCMIYETVDDFEDFFPLNETNNKITDDELLHLNFYMMNETKSAWILLSKKAEYNEDTDEKEYYEIVMGNERNSEIWGGNKMLVKIDPIIPYILWDYGPIIQIEIIQKKNGTLLVYVPNYSIEPIMEYFDSSPLELNYFSLWSDDTTPRIWFHSCPFDNLNCQRGFCATPEYCTFHPGFILSNSNKSYCDPICRDGCPNGFCYSPGKCSCNDGYFKTTATNVCEPVCEERCPNGFCVAPGKCECNDGYFKTATTSCTPVCEQGCANGFCSAPQKCTCSDGYQWSDDNMQCEPICKNGCENGYCRYPGLCYCNNGYLWNANKCQLV